MFGLMDGGTQNPTFWTGAAATPGTSWQYFSQQVTAVKDATPSNVLYLSTPAGAYTTSGWTLEFQGFEIRRI